jgi:hypothetical protein
MGLRSAEQAPSPALAAGPRSARRRRSRFRPASRAMATGLHSVRVRFAAGSTNERHRAAMVRSCPWAKSSQPSFSARHSSR